MDYDRLRELQEKFDENPRRYFAPLANEYRKGGQPKRAIEICRAHLAQMPGHMSGQIVFGQALFESGEWDEARAVFGRALALDPENLIALRSLGDMSLQAGPKDAAVTALVSEIDASSEGTAPPALEEIPHAEARGAEQEIAEAPAAEASVPPAIEVEATAPAPEPIAENVEEPLGLERHYPTETVEEVSVEEAGSAELLASETGEAIAGIKSSREDDAGALSWGPTSEEMETVAGPSLNEPEAPVVEDQPAAAEPEPAAAEYHAPPPPEPEPAAAEYHAPPPPEPEPVQPPQRAKPPAAKPEPVAAASEDRGFSGASAEPFVNETMAQLYLQQGYRQLALKVYRQLSASRPHDQALRDRIAEIEAADAAEHPDEVAAMRREEPPIERPAEPPAPRSPSIEAPPTREEPRAEPEGYSARQPSVREFFATLGRRRPPRTAGSPPMRSGNNRPAEPAPMLATPAPSASLDAVFAGATVSPADARAASRLAGAFSGAAGSGTRSPATPAVPTPRVNPRMPPTHESEEDVAKFRAWLDGLTRE